METQWSLLFAAVKLPFLGHTHIFTTFLWVFPFLWGCTRLQRLDPQARPHEDEAEKDRCPRTVPVIWWWEWLEDLVKWLVIQWTFYPFKMIMFYMVPIWFPYGSHMVPIRYRWYTPEHIPTQKRQMRDAADAACCVTCFAVRGGNLWIQQNAAPGQPWRSKESAWDHIWLIWLVVWNMAFIFSIYWEFHHPNGLSYFSDGLKPPTGENLHSLHENVRSDFL